MSETPLGNSPEARSPTGEILDPTVKIEPIPADPKPEPTAGDEPTVEAKPDAEKKPDAPKKEGEKSLLNEKDPKAEGVPEKYEFKLPEGFELKEESAKELDALFRPMGLSQENAQKLMDFHSKMVQQAMGSPQEAYLEMRKEWRSEVASDPVLGKNLAAVKTSTSRMIDGLGDAKLASEFRAAMDLTGAGDHPAFIRLFNKLAEKFGEGTHVPGGGPSKFGQARDGKPASAAHALYPNLP